MNIETMEGRVLFSVSVTEGYPGYFEVQGDSSPDTINISVDQDQETFTLDDTTYTGVAFIWVYGGDGADTISVTSTYPGAIGTSVSGDAGDDDITVNFDGSVWGGAGNDTIRLSDSFRGEVYGDGDDDQITISGECVDAVVYGGDGDDILDATANHYGALLDGGNGNDTIYGGARADEIYGGSGMNTVYGFAGNDVIYTANGAADTVDGGTGSDTLHGDTVEASITSIEHIV